jgi:hypothetical protein
MVLIPLSIANTYLPIASVVSWSELLTSNLEVPGSIPGATGFSE